MVCPLLDPFTTPRIFTCTSLLGLLALIIIAFILYHGNHPQRRPLQVRTLHPSREAPVTHNTRHPSRQSKFRQHWTPSAESGSEHESDSMLVRLVEEAPKLIGGQIRPRTQAVAYTTSVPDYKTGLRQIVRHWRWAVGGV